MEEYDDDDYEKLFADQMEMMQEMEAEANSQVKTNDAPKQKLSETLDPKRNEYNPLDFKEDNLSTDPAVLKKRKSLYGDKNLEDLEIDDLQVKTTEYPMEPFEDISSYGNKKDSAMDFVQSEEPEVVDMREFTKLNVSLLDGRKYALKMFEEQGELKEIDRPREKNILGKSIEALKLELNAEKISKHKENIEEMNKSSGTTVTFDPKNTSETALWVEKFKPKNFMELLSDDGTNRLILSWMKSWDYVVFNKEMHSEAQSVLSTKQLNIAAAKKRKRVFNQYEADFEDKILELDQYNRPKIKVCLIAGPPGLGKTTLAHIIAKHAGYNIIEMNASDDRSADAFKQNIESVTQSRGSVNQNEKTYKPSCLIIDEIDGAPQNSIQVLIDHVMEKEKKKKNTGEPKGPTMLRPIICICNDLYTPSLKNLRPISIVFQCPNIATQRLAERLNTVCTVSNINAEIGGLVALCEKTRNDIRSSLNTLQFLSSRSMRITSKLINELTIGHKDYEKSIYEIMNEVFFTMNNAKKSIVNKEMASKFTLIHSMCQNCDSDKLFQALHENFLSIKFRDNNFQSVNKANEWLMFCDTLNKQVREKQDFFLYRYQNYMPALFYKLFSTSSAPDPKNRLKYPHTQYENMVKMNKNMGILKHFQADMSPLVRVAFNSFKYIVIDLLPFFNDILQPNLRSVALQLFTKIEKDKLENLIQTMLLFNLNYRQEKAMDGQYSYVLDPNIDDIIKLSGMKQRKQLGYMLKQQLAREITLEKVKLADKYKSKDSDGKQAGKPISTKPSIFKNVQKAAEAGNMSPKSSPLRNLTSMMKEKNTELVVPGKERADKFREKNCFSNFFIKKEKKWDEGMTPNTRKVTEIEREKEAKLEQSLNDGVWLKYKEGFINAVRYSIKISDLL